MVKANELRIGNLISDDDGCVAKINGFTPFSHSVRCDEAEGCILLIDVYHELTGKWKMGREADSPECNPIPLAPEWMERCGFEYKDGACENGDYRHNGVYIYQHDEEPGLFHFSRGHMEGAKVEIKYLHQLQNIYFTLVGEE